MDNVDLHLTVLAEWMVRTVGRALLLSLVVPVVIAVVGVFANSAGMVALGIAIGPLIFAYVLWNATAPLPHDVKQSP